MTNEKRANKHESDYSIAAGVAREFPVLSRGKAKRLLRTLSRDMEWIRKANIYAQKTQGGSASASCEWIADNFYVFEKEYANLKAALRLQKDVQLSFSSVPRQYLMAKEYIKRIDRPLDESACEAFCASLCEGAAECNFSDYFSAELFCTCAVISLFANECKKLCTDSQSTSSRSFALLVSSIKYIPIYRFDAEPVCLPTEKLLRSDPSNFYPLMDDETKMCYRERVAILSKKKKISESELVRRALMRAKSAKDLPGTHIGAHLFPDKNNAVYFPLLICITLALCFVLFLYSPVFLVLAFPVFECVKTLLDFIYSSFIPAKPVFKLKLSQIPENTPVLAVVTTLLCGKESDGEIFDRLERIYNANCGKNIYFGVLCDLPDSDSATNSKDGAIIEYARDRIDALCAKYGKNFFLFVRHRVYSKSEKKFIAWERKRGAVIELVRFLKKEKTSFDFGEKNPFEDFDFEKIKYVITLDADTNLSLDCVLELVGAMLHPLNRPIIDKKKKIVCSGYGIMQPKAAPSLVSAQSTPFTNLFCGSGGIEIYSGASFDLYQSLFSEGIFCGKGIFDKDAFYEVIDKSDSFPEEMVLSHDILEGARLRCALVSDMELTDTFPKNALSYLKRQHRWVRGDVQNLKFLCKTVKDAEGKKYKNEISALSKFKIFDNVRRHASIVFSFFGVIISSFLPKEYALLFLSLSLLPYLLPFLFDATRLIFHLSFDCAARRFFSKGVTTGIWQSFLRFLFNVCFLCKNATSVLDALVRSFYRMTISRKNLLQWVTAKQADSAKSTVFLYIQKNLFSAIIGFLLFALSPYGAVKLVGLFWFLLPVVAYTTSKENSVADKTDTEKNERMKEYARDIWKFFEENVNESENFLPPDNIALFPSFKVAHRTSPTNIGLYIASCVCARDFGFIDTHTMAKKLSECLRTVASLEKYCGHLYNWYDTETLSVLSPKYVSSVDSGNFVACLIFAKEAVVDFANEDISLLEIKDKLCALIEETDFTPLYDKKRELFSQGITFLQNGAERVPGCYDIFMSEARITSYIACAKRIVPKKHWFSLSRLLVSHGGHIGLCSWTGTAFEYYMPALFLPAYKNSLCHEAFSFALYAQRQRRALQGALSVWGISESGFFSYDADMNYQYKAHGIPLLALKRGMEDDLVISPYSSFLSLCISKKASLANLERQEKLSAYGRYGFYEAIDFTKTRTDTHGALIKSYMSHHLGMSLLALCNACFANLVQKRFMRDVKMACGYELLEEKIPVNATVREIKKRRDIPERINRPEKSDGAYFEDPNFESGHIEALSDGNLTGIIGQNGHIALKNKKEELIDRENEKYELCESLFSFIEQDGKCFSLSPLPNINPRGVKYGFYKSEGEARHEITYASQSNLCASAAYTISSYGSSVFRVKLKAVTDKTDSFCRCAFAFRPVIADYASYSAHPAFSSLFIEASFDEKEKILFFKRRPRNSEDKKSVLAVGLVNKEADFLFDTRAQDIFSPKFSCMDFANIFSRTPVCSTGACIVPFCLVQSKMTKKGTENLCELLLTSAESESMARWQILSARGEDFGSAKSSLCASSCLLTDNICTQEVLDAEESMLSAVYFCDEGKKDVNMEDAGFFSKRDLWQYSISADLPIITIRLGSHVLGDMLSRYIIAYKRLFSKNILFDLVFLYADEEKYFSPCKSRILQEIEKCKATAYLRRAGGGIFVLDVNDAGAKSVFYASVASFDIYSRKETEEEKRKISEFTLPQTRAKLEKKTLQDGENFGGKFCEDGFLVDKAYNLKVPFSHVITGENISTVLSANSLGYTFLKNSALRRITPFENDVMKEMNSERILLFANGKIYDLCAVSEKCLFEKNTARYFGKIDEAEYEITVCVFEKFTAKKIEVKLFPQKDCEISVFFAAVPLMSQNKSDSRFCITEKKVGMVEFKNPFSEHFSQYTGFVFGFERKSRRFARALNDKAHLFSGAPAKDEQGSFAAVGFDIKLSQGCTFCADFALGAYKDIRVREKIIKLLQSKTENESIRGLLPHIKCEFPENSHAFALPLSNMFNFWLPYQNSVCRMIARSGFYQSGGAYGFRDQLQDCITLMYSDTQRALRHIYRAAAHQFPEGDALHWWHQLFCGENMLHYGIRTRCSDDYLFLPYVCAKFFEYTGSAHFLNMRIRYADAPPLCDGELEKYVGAKKSDIRESLYLHCIRALRRGVSLLGERGLCLMGSCDWSDGLSRVGKDGRGESVWLSMFLVLCAESFLPICRAQNDSENEEYLLKHCIKLRESIEKYGYDKAGSRYIRGYYDDGEAFGVLGNEECEIDILPQSFAPVSRVGNNERNLVSLDVSYRLLFDNDEKILKLFTPAFANTKKDPGYIKGYVAGIRENGGQYTHAAVWGIMGFFEMAKKLYREGRQEDAKRMQEYGRQVLYCINPAYRTSAEFENAVISEKYLAEPYCMAADIYSNEQHCARAGWTWYTGAAGWYWRVILEYVFGIKFSSVCTEPTLYLDTIYPLPTPELLDGAQMKIEIGGGVYTISYKRASEAKIFLDGVQTGHEIRISDGKHHIICEYL